MLVSFFSVNFTISSVFYIRREVPYFPPFYNTNKASYWRYSQWLNFFSYYYYSNCECFIIWNISHCLA